ncbi:MAG: hypothetical protein HY059_22230 [Proteobacteria bacterium]|nr:hypothetical protein [Pseudomonadota bacterium]
MTGELEQRLASIDFSGESRVRDSLRARLLAPGRDRRAEPAPVFIPLRLGFALAALAVALLAPVRRDALRLFGSEGLSRGPNGLPVLTGTLPVRHAMRERSLLMTLPAVHPMVTAQAEVVRTPRGSALRWRLPGAVVTLERRTTSLEELFEKRTL